MRHRFDFSPIFAWLVAALFVSSGVPQLLAASTTLNYQGRVIANGMAFQGTGHFKFALISSDGNTVYWKNDASTGSAEPASAVGLNVNRGLFSIRLGDTSLPNMTALDSAVLSNAGVKLRVWFNDGSKGFQQMNRDQDVNYSSSASVVAGNLYTASGLTSPTGKLFSMSSGVWQRFDFVGYSGTGRVYADSSNIYAQLTYASTDWYKFSCDSKTYSKVDKGSGSYLWAEVALDGRIFSARYFSNANTNNSFAFLKIDENGRDKTTFLIPEPASNSSGSAYTALVKGVLYIIVPGYIYMCDELMSLDNIFIRQ